MTNAPIYALITASEEGGNGPFTGDKANIDTTRAYAEQFAIGGISIISGKLMPVRISLVGGFAITGMPDGILKIKIGSRDLLKFKIKEDNGTVWEVTLSFTDETFTVERSKRPILAIGSVKRPPINSGRPTLRAA